MKWITSKRLQKIACTACFLGIGAGSSFGMLMTGDPMKDGEEYLKENNLPKAIECFQSAAVKGENEAFKKFCKLFPAKDTRIRTC